MKIPSQNPPQVITSVTPAQPGVKKVTPDTDKAQRKTTNSSSSTQHRICHWFASVGIEQSSAGYGAYTSKQVAQFNRLREQKRITNLQRIMAIALSVSPGEQQQERIDPDWFHSFIMMAENIYSPTMQELWGKIFAVEVQRPGSFSLRSLETLTKLTQRDAKLFSKACLVACRRNHDPAPIIITGYHQQSGLLRALFTAPSAQTKLSHFGLSYSDILALGSMKLLYATEIETGLLNKNTPFTLKFAQHSVTVQPKANKLLMSYYKFTAVGSELSRLLPKPESEGFTQHLEQVFAPHFTLS
ncbi:TIGR03899 family protein [Alteromonas gilva]|uniref:TIGR03899 family protein n=1 Tax=Alteromonas gilva TaxID=2987522 RepID=A0ABT5L5I5_9ALTE|nr:TIGR03899 family protein [Alteromonas gilva]MDC8832323.1 TIGR03899 family protein [Alteromonas gilva]